MNKEQYLRALAGELRKLPKEEYERAIDYYVEYFEDAGPEHEEEAINDLGTPHEVASQIITDAAMKRMDNPATSVKKGFSTIWLVILAVCAAPIALPMAIAIVVMVGAVLVMIGVAMVGVVVSVAGFLATGVVSIVGGIAVMFHQPASGVVNFGAGLVIVGFSILAGFLVCWIIRWIFKGVRALFRRIVKRGKKG